MDKKFDALERHCPRLGGPVRLAYCKASGNGDRPCWKILDCWWERLDILDYLQKNLPGKTLEGFASSRPKPKLSSLVELIEQAKKRVQ